MSLMHDDYLLREVRRLVDAVLRLRRRRREAEDTSPSDADGDLEARVGLPLTLLERMDDETLLGVLSPAGALDVGRAVALAFVWRTRDPGGALGTRAAWLLDEIDRVAPPPVRAELDAARRALDAEGP